MAHVHHPITNYKPPHATPHPDLEKIAVDVFEEKGTDVKLGVHMVRDALKGEVEQAAVITNDTDLVEPVRIVIELRSSRTLHNQGSGLFITGWPTSAARSLISRY